MPKKTFTALALFKTAAVAATLLVIAASSASACNPTVATQIGWATPVGVQPLGSCNTPVVEQLSLDNTAYGITNGGTIVVNGIPTAAPASALVVGDCDQDIANAQRTFIQDFADGDIRAFALDEGPKASGTGVFNRGTVHIMLTFPRSETSSAACALVSANEWGGFRELRLAELSHQIRPDGSLILYIPVVNIVGGDILMNLNLVLSVDQVSGIVTAVYSD